MSSTARHVATSATRSFLLVLALCATPAFAAGSDPASHGQTIGEWSADWWNWVVGFPAASNPLFASGEVDCAAGQSGPVWFLAGNFGGTTQRECSVPSDKALFFPILNNVRWAPEDAGTSAELRAMLHDDMQLPHALTCELDGVPCVESHAMTREQSPDFTVQGGPGTLVEEFFGEGDRTPAVSDGWWVMLSPLPEGDHVLHFAVKAPPFRLDVTFLLHVEAP